MATQHHPRIPYTRWSKPRSCFTSGGYPKLRFEHRWQAKAAARALAEKGKGDCHAYLCPCCQWFHIGHE